MNLGRYIHSLLLEHDTVIIPGLGAFVSEYAPAKLDDGSGKFSPPSKKISFEPKIRTNDGLLMGEIAHREQIPVAEAINKIEQERDNILFRLDKGEQVTLEKTGIIQFTEDRKIRFDPFQQDNLLLSTYGLENISLNEDTTDTSGTDKAIKGYSDQEPGEEIKNRSYQSLDYDLIESGSVLPYKTARRKNKRTGLWFMLIFIPIIAGGIFFITKKNKKTPIKIETVNNPIVQDNELAPEKLESMPVPTANDSLEVSKIDSTETTIKTIDPAGYISPDTSKFYLVSGSFKEEGNSKKHLEYLKNKGYEPFHLGKHGNFYIVGIEIYNTEREAFAAQYDFLDKYPDSGVWVYHPE